MVVDMFNDLWVNWFEGKDKGYDVCEFFEWRNTDNIKLLDRIPVIKVTREFFAYVENSLNDLPEDLLFKVKNKATITQCGTRKAIDYCFLLVEENFENMLAVDTDGFDVPMRKSRLIPRNYMAVATKFSDLAVSSYKPVKRNFKYDSWYSADLSEQKNMLGLTRHERTLKEYLIMALQDKERHWNYEETSYWYKEFCNKDSRYYPQGMLLSSINAKVKETWEPHYEKLLQSITHGDVLYETLIANEMGAYLKQ